uniref:Ycf80 n=1 Tax=Melanthalia intermedia TaxID=172989 RepID=A0A345UAL8_9FLOR|nr:hypothetical protein [Melanthalia intermedia]AXI97504.1 hypothetical protein [Melanthalia intermedia]
MFNQYSILYNSNLYSLPLARNEYFFNDDNKLLENKTLISRNFLTKLVNKYWQETIFLSAPNSLSNRYIDQLKSDGILIYKNEHKKFLLDFSKALFSGRIKVLLNDYKVSNDLKKKTIDTKNNSVPFVWRKGLNFPLPRRIPALSIFKQDNSYLNKRQSCFLKRIRQYPFPIFTVVNKLNQMMLTESREEIVSSLKVVDKIYRWYCHNFVNNQIFSSLYYGLFFVHPSDALEYLNSIKHKNSDFAQNNLSLLSTKLEIYYKLSRVSRGQIRIKLIPDLKEIANLIYRYKYYDNIHFHNNQKYGKNFFKGQPIYFIKPIYSLNRLTQKTSLVHYNYAIELNSQKDEFQSIFTNYKTAVEAWRKFRQKCKNYKLPHKPQILVYNLEDFIKLYDNNEFGKYKNITLVPSQASYEFIKQNQVLREDKATKQIFFREFFRFQRFAQKIVWSLSNKQPTNWQK